MRGEENQQFIPVMENATKKSYLEDVLKYKILWSNQFVTLLLKRSHLKPKQGVIIMFYQ